MEFVSSAVEVDAVQQPKKPNENEEPVSVRSSSTSDSKTSEIKLDWVVQHAVDTMKLESTSLFKDRLRMVTSSKKDNFWLWNATSISLTTAALSYFNTYEPYHIGRLYTFQLLQRFLAWYDGLWIWNRRPTYWSFNPKTHPITVARQTIQETLSLVDDLLEETTKTLQ